jgi:hypothetical protein
LGEPNFVSFLFLSTQLLAYVVARDVQMKDKQQLNKQIKNKELNKLDKKLKP